jgi:hypothetical protein
MRGAAIAAKDLRAWSHSGCSISPPSACFHNAPAHSMPRPIPPARSRICKKPLHGEAAHSHTTGTAGTRRTYGGPLARRVHAASYSEFRSLPTFLRWHYPDQVQRDQGGFALSQPARAPLVDSPLTIREFPATVNPEHRPAGAVTCHPRYSRSRHRPAGAVTCYPRYSRSRHRRTGAVTCYPRYSRSRHCPAGAVTCYPRYSRSPHRRTGAVTCHPRYSRSRHPPPAPPIRARTAPSKLRRCAAT